MLPLVLAGALAVFVSAPHARPEHAAPQKPAGAAAPRPQPDAATPAPTTPAAHESEAVDEQGAPRTSTQATPRQVDERRSRQPPAEPRAASADDAVTVPAGESALSRWSRRVLAGIVVILVAAAGWVLVGRVRRPRREPFAGGSWPDPTPQPPVDATGEEAVETRGEVAASAPGAVTVSLSSDTLEALRGLVRGEDHASTTLVELRAATELLQKQLQQQNQYLRTWNERHKQLAQHVEEISRRDLDAYFNQWKHAYLEEAQHDDVSRTLDEFGGDPAVARDLDSARETLERTAARARIWFESFAAWDPPALLPSSSSSRHVVEAVAEYCERGMHFVRTLDEWLANADLRTVPPEPGVGVTFYDVVAGRSAAAMAGGYRARLERRREEVVTKAQALATEWTRLREELPALLDGYYAVTADLVMAGGRVVEDRTLARALETAQVQEIPVQPGSTPFDSKVHEAVPGARRLRSDLPENTVVGLERRGFFHEGKVLRRALVTLSSTAA